MQDLINGSSIPRAGEPRSRSVAHVAARGLLALGLVSAVGAVGAGCLNRPVQPGEPTTKTNFTAVVKQAGIDKVDILFAIDNSASMGDKQELLRLAVPDLVNRLINPFCVDDTEKVLAPSKNGDCNGIGGKVEFPPIHDMHIGIISSALGGRGGDRCLPDEKNPANSALNGHNDDGAHLINRAGAQETPVASAGTGNFLAWLPDVDANRGKPDPTSVTKLVTADAFKKDFQDLVSGVHEYGCGFEAQLESVYRFLNQPDPYEKIIRDGNRAALDGIDKTLLQQRADFLRPDSLVAVIMITDENESTVDPLSVSGQGWAFLNSSFPGSPNTNAAKRTSACDANPLDANCTSCGFKKNPDGTENTKVTQDPNCQENGGYYNGEDDNLNVRPIRMKQRFGVDPQFPASRYIQGLKGARVPNRKGEHPVGSNGAPQPYLFTNKIDCTNPLFAANLPTDPGADLDKAIDDVLCHLPPGPRTPELVFFAVIGGVPWQLLAKDPAAALDKVELKDQLTNDDWNKIIGKDPLQYNYDGIDVHMVESFDARPGLPPASAGDTADPFHGREWDTAKKDLQFACTFQLPKTDQQPNGTKDCNLAQFKSACDCDGQKNPPLCDATTKTTQVRGKAYPSIREFAVVRALGEQGIISSICPIKVEDPTGTDPLFGYRPAVKTIIDRLKNALSRQCLPQALKADASGEVPCLILETLGTDGPESECNNATAYPGRSIPEQTILDKVRESQRAEQRGDAGGEDLTKRPVCKLKQLVVKPGESCADAPEAGWCYVTNGAGGDAAGTCPQAILFTEAASRARGSKFSLQCIRASEGSAGAAASGDGGATAP